MIQIDKFTNVTISSALLHCHSMSIGDIKAESGYPSDVFEKLEKKYSDQITSIDEVDLPIIIKALEWMLVIRDESNLLDINHKQGLELINLLKNAENGQVSVITAHQWCFGAESLRK